MTPASLAPGRRRTSSSARTLANLLWKGELEAVWMPDERCRILRRRLARREQLVRSRSRAKNEIHACLARRLQAKPPCSDLFGVKGRRWLAGLDRPVEERGSVDAASFIAAVGNADRFMTSRKLVAYLGLAPRVKQSGEGPARSGRISKRGSPSARWALVEAAWSTVLQPGPLHGFYERTKHRRGHGKAIVATARKLSVLFW